ncbi:uncharacterized protein LOC129787529 isoform X1 [Lutzomyia longipalpis]|uniref:uncharacterized protein LOC129787529 isoform X1 n=1 Tax=Lutzomyia longipalpis TaxID=7200 RepID=UPI0024836F93|nr:uncharacterized protein LOC129787529 isoform X1 [Lutzomyia longipalpis]XP_055679198.1 uncharacterized protein LOC129787529 isoform X1 [Lutzomyia longipalpis]
MVTCKVDTLSKMNRTRRGSSSSSGFRLLGDHCDTMSSISRNSIYKQKIDLMFDDSRSIISHRFDDCTSVRDRKSSIHGSSFRGSTRGSVRNREHRESKRISNSVQAQIEKMFTDVAKDASSNHFSVRCLGALPLPSKVTSLQGLQEPLRQLYLSGAGHGNQNAGNLDICAKGLRVRLTNGREPLLTPFHNIAVWSAVKFVVSASEGGAAFLPLITDPENIDKSTLFRPLNAADKRRLSSSLHAPIFAVVMRSASIPKQLECHAFVCQSPEDAIVIAATLYQSLMAHMDNGPNDKTRRPKNRNGVSCMSIASSSVTKKLGSSIGQKSVTHRSIPPPARPPRKKRSATSSLSGESDAIREAIETETSTEERKKKSSKTKRAPPIPLSKEKPGEMYNSSMSYLNEQSKARNSAAMPLPSQTLPEPPYQSTGHDASSGDILTRVAIPRSGSFLNTSGLTRYKSRATRRHAGKLGGGGGSPLGFSELFNEFRLQENLHSLDDILNAIINSDGMSFNDLKPIYKEFLLKLAVTLTKDELYQRSKSIMRRQKKKKLRRRNSNVQNQRKKMLIGAKGLKKVFRFGKFRSGKSIKAAKTQTQIPPPQLPQSTKGIENHLKNEQRIRAGTSGSDVSEARNEHTMNAQNRNSSSGYVSCSECSYDSEACTCTSADRCYCSLGADQMVSAKLSCSATTPGNRESLMTCRTEDKCYCSMGEGAESHTTWCDTDSCVSASKCYCRRVGNTKPIQNCRGRRDNLALDYELFTVGGGGGGSGDSGDTEQRAQEALSVKKSVEMAAVFADVKLSQTTDISSIAQNHRERKNRCPKSNLIKSDFTTKSEGIAKKEIRDKLSKRTTKSEGYYQTVNPGQISASLEDSLGYLP